MAGTTSKRKTTKTSPPVAASGALRELEQSSDPKAAKQEVQLSNVSVSRCLRCGVSTTNPKDLFLKSLGSSLYKTNMNYVPICKSCLKELYEDAIGSFNDFGMAIQLCCHYMDWPYVEEVAYKAREAEPAFPLPDYYRRISIPKYRVKTYKTSMVKFNAMKSLTSQQRREAVEKTWDQESLRNMSYVKNIFGYDPFTDDSLTSSDRKYLFNTMAGYCPDSTIGSDSHKLQSILNIVLLQLQVQKVGEQINQELAKNPVNAKLVDEYTTIQKNLYQSINNMAKENGVSASGNGGTKPANTLTERMKLLQEEGFEEIEVNMFNIEQSKALQKVADISMNSILKELRLEDNDYSEIVATQRQLISSLTQERDQAVEELRILSNQKKQREYEEQQYLKQKQKEEKANKEKDGEA